MATVTFKLDHPKEGKKTTILAVFYISDAIRPEISTGERVIPEAWATNRVKGGVKCGPTKTEASHINLHLAQIETDLMQLWRDNKNTSRETITSKAKLIIRGQLAVADKKKLLDTVLKAFLEWLKKDYSKLYVAKFITLGNKLRAFDPKLQIDGLDFNFFDAFKDELYNQGLIDSSVYKTLINFGTFLDWAEKRGHEIHYTGKIPTHRAVEIIYRKPKKEDIISFTLSEFEAIEAVEITEELIDEKLPPDPHGRRGDRTVQALELTRDYLRIECRTAQRISDIKSFDRKDVINKVWENRVKKGAQRTGGINRIPFDTVFAHPAWQVLEKHNFKLPALSEVKLNKNIKLLARLAGITKKHSIRYWVRNEEITIEKEKCDLVSSHTARKTFITLGLQFMPRKTVKDLAGISEQTLQHYEGMTEDRILKDGLNSMPVMKIAS